MNATMPNRFVQDQVVTAHFNDGATWDVHLGQIAMIGEYSTQDGPGNDDHFFCIVDKDGNRYDVSDEEGGSQFLSELSFALGEPLIPQLSLSTGFKSCILYPREFYGCPLFAVPPDEPTSFIRRLQFFFSKDEHELCFGNEASALLARKK